MFSENTTNDRIIVKNKEFSLNSLHDNNIQKIHQYNFPITIDLPALISEHNQIQLRPISAIIERILALTVVATKGEGLIQNDVLETMAQLGAAPFLTLNEREFVYCANPSIAELEFYTAKYEAIDVLLWSIGYKKTMLEPYQGCAVMSNKLIIRDHYLHLQDQAIKINTEQLVNKSDFYYKLCLAIQTLYEKKIRIDGIYVSAAFERMHALSWLIFDKSWD